MTQSIEHEQDATINGYSIPPGFLAPIEIEQDTVEPAEEDLAAELTQRRKVAAARVAGQDDPALVEEKTASELAADRKVAQIHRKGMRREQRAENKAARRFARRERRTGYEIARLDQRDQLDARKATATRRRLTSPASSLARMHRDRMLSLLCVSLPAVFGILLGAGNVQAELSQLAEWQRDTPLYWLAFLFEPIVTLPLVGVLTYQAGSNGRDTAGLGRVEKWALLLVAAALNSVPHLLNGEPRQALVWLLVPVMIGVTLSLLPRLATGYAERLVDARTEAALTAPVGNLDGDTAKLLRSLAYVQALDAAGQIGGDRDENDLPSATQIAKSLRGQQGHVGKDTGRRIKAALQVLQGCDQHETDPSEQ